MFFLISHVLLSDRVISTILLYVSSYELSNTWNEVENREGDLSYTDFESGYLQKL